MEENPAPPSAHLQALRKSCDSPRLPQTMVPTWTCPCFPPLQQLESLTAPSPSQACAELAQPPRSGKSQPWAGADRESLVIFLLSCKDALKYSLQGLGMILAAHTSAFCLEV